MRYCELQMSGDKALSMIGDSATRSLESMSKNKSISVPELKDDPFKVRRAELTSVTVLACNELKRL